MPSKAYSKEEREEMSQRLLQAGLELYSIHGIKNVGLMDILKKVGISKPFFYTFYDSVQEFVVCLLDYQWSILYELVEKTEEHSQWDREEKCYNLFLYLIERKKNGLLIMTQQEELWVSKKIGKANVQAFMDRQVNFFRYVLQLWNIPEEACPPEVLGNLVISILVVHGSTEESFPFLYTDSLEETARMQARALAKYLATLQLKKI